MNLNKIEKILIRYFFQKKQPYFKEKESFFSDITLESRDLTGVGFFSNLNKSEKLKIGSANLSYKWGDIGLKLNSSIDTGYLFYVEEGYLTTIEGYTYSDYWPKKVSQVEIYTISGFGYE